MRRRQFLHAVAGSAAVGARCSDGGPRTTPTVTGSTGTHTRTPAPDTVELLGTGRLYEHREELVALLHEAGLPDRITVRLRQPSFTTEARLGTVMQILESGAARPTLISVRSEDLNHLAGRALLDPFDDSLPGGVPAGLFDRPVDEVVRAATHDGSSYGFPLFGDVGGLFYRRDLLAEAGYDPDLFADPPEWRRFAEVVADVRDGTSAGGGYGVQLADYEGLACCAAREVLASFGGGYFGAPSEHAFGPVGDRPVTLDAEPIRRTLSLLAGFLHGPDGSVSSDVPAIIPQRALEWTEEPTRTAFADGELVAHRNWPYVIRLDEGPDGFGDDLGLAPLPSGLSPSDAPHPRTGGSRSTVASSHLLVNHNAPEETRADARAVLSAMATPTFRRGLFEHTGLLPPVRDDLLSDAVRESPYGRYAATLADLFERGVHRPGTFVWEQQSAAIAETFHDVLSGDAGLDALADLESEVERLEADGADA